MRSPEYSAAARRQLLDLARASISHGLEAGVPLPVEHAQMKDPLRQVRATFVTLTRLGQLRGCTGTLEAARPLAIEVSETAFQTAFRDPRFQAIRSEELTTLDIEISVLSPLEPMAVVSEDDLLAQLVPGVDGLVIDDGGWHRATFLPKVWESLPAPDVFLGELKQKAGLPRERWPREMQVFRYHTETFGSNPPTCAGA